MQLALTEIDVDGRVVLELHGLLVPRVVGRKIRRHKGHILNTVRNGLSNARIEATNNKIKLPLRITYGFRNIDTMISLVMLFCSSIEIPWPGRRRKGPTNKGTGTTQAA